MVGALGALAGALSANSPTSPAKIEITAYGSKPLKLVGTLLNPTELSLDRKNAWQQQRGGGGSGQPAESNGMTFAGGEDNFSFSFLLDASEKPKDDLIKDMQALYNIARPFTFDESETKIERPPVIGITWGEFKFTGVVESVSMKVSLFDHNAKFKRMNVTMALKGEAFRSPSEDFLTKVAKAADKAKAGAAGGTASKGLF